MANGGGASGAEGEPGWQRGAGGGDGLGPPEGSVLITCCPLRPEPYPHVLGEPPRPPEGFPKGL